MKSLRELMSLCEDKNIIAESGLCCKRCGSDRGLPNSSDNCYLCETCAKRATKNDNVSLVNEDNESPKYYSTNPKIVRNANGKQIGSTYFSREENGWIAFAQPRHDHEVFDTEEEATIYIEKSYRNHISNLFQKIKDIRREIKYWTGK